jgi:hypothetical protein
MGPFTFTEIGKMLEFPMDDLGDRVLTMHHPDAQDPMNIVRRGIGTLRFSQHWSFH